MASTFIQLPPDAGSSGFVESFNGRTGAVIPLEPDYAAFYSPIITGGASSIVSANLTASRALASDGSGKVAVSAVTTTEQGYLSGVTSAIQTQLNAKQALDATLTALAAYNTNGLLTQTAADTFVGRTIAGTASQITATNGDGVAGNPTLSLADNGVTAGTYIQPTLTIDSKGRISTALDISDGLINHSKAYEWFEDWTAQVTTITGSMYMSAVVSGTASITAVATTLLQGHPGVMAYATSAVAASAAHQHNPGIIFGTGGRFINEHVVKLNSLPDVTDDFNVYAGFGNTASGGGLLQTDGAGFMADRTHATSGVNWVAITSTNASRTAVDTGIPYSTNWVTLRVVVDPTSAYFYINDVLVATITTNIPTARPTGIVVGQERSAGTANRIVYGDCVYMGIFFPSGRS